MLVNAETLEYNICKSGCEYSSLEEITNHFEEIYNEVGEEVFSTYDVIINFKDSETYEEGHFGYGYVSSLTINGNNAKITVDEVSFLNIKKVIFENLTITASSVVFVGKYDYSKLGNPEYNEYKNNVFNINNCSIKTNIWYFEMGTFNISNSSLNGTAMCNLLSDVNMHKTSLMPFLLLSGGEGAYDSNVYLNMKYLDNDKDIIRLLPSEENANEIDARYPEVNESVESNLDLDKYFFIESPLTEEYINNGITKTNNIFIKQEVSKNIKGNTNISEFESEFVNTYEDSIGYDDIKDLPIEWKSENESIVKLENGVIVPVSAGNVDLVGTRGNDIYTIHLTVEKETIPEKIDKMTIKVPITGSKVKAWVVVIGALLLGVI